MPPLDNKLLKCHPGIKYRIEKQLLAISSQQTQHNIDCFNISRLKTRTRQRALGSANMIWLHCRQLAPDHAISNRAFPMDAFCNEKRLCITMPSILAVLLPWDEGWSFPCNPCHPVVPRGTSPNRQAGGFCCNPTTEEALRVPDRRKAMLRFLNLILRVCLLR